MARRIQLPISSEDTCATCGAWLGPIVVVPFCSHTCFLFYIDVLRQLADIDREYASQ